MKTPRDILIERSIQQPEDTPPTSEYHGLLLRYHPSIWNGSLWGAHQQISISNTLLLSFLGTTNHTSLLLRDPQGIHGLYSEKISALHDACAIQRLLEDKKIPASCILYTGVGVLQDSIWLCNEQYLAESIVMVGTPYRLLLSEQFAKDLLPPTGVGFFPAGASEQNLYHQRFYHIKDYRK